MHVSGVRFICGDGLKVRGKIRIRSRIVLGLRLGLNLESILKLGLWLGIGLVSWLGLGLGLDSV